MIKRTSNVRQAPPKAVAMLESLRGLGYSTATALADIVDNSISAQATEVNIGFFWNGDASRIMILDDGNGMSDAELENAMSLGGKNPLEIRDPTDLGRFGMGLKTASLSQCRRLTVASVQDGQIHCLRWDLDALALRPDDGWLLFEGAALGSEGYFEILSSLEKGSLVLWELLDRIVTKGYTEQDFLDLIDQIERHLAMVFHRLLQGPKPRLRILLNGHPINPWDPFMSDHPAKPWNSPIARRSSHAGAVEIECHVLPHKDRLTTEEHDTAGGPEGWTAQQGFYVYRNERLLVAGGWLGLGQGRAWNKEEAHRLARIRLDISNTADSDWKIDIRKSRAQPPVALRPWLTKLAEDTRIRARRVFAYRGSPIPSIAGVSIAQAWMAEQSRSGTRYRIDTKHPAIAAVLDMSGSHLKLVKAMLRVIEETVPVQRIWLDTTENKETPRSGFSGEPTEKVVEVLEALFEDMTKRRGMSSRLAKKALSATEPFQNYPNLIENLPDDSDFPQVKNS